MCSSGTIKKKKKITQTNKSTRHARSQTTTKPNKGQTFLGGCRGRVGTAHELHPAEDIDATGEEHGEALDLHATLLASVGRRPVPLVKVPALGLVVDVVEQAMFRHEESVRLESSRCQCQWLLVLVVACASKTLLLLACSLKYI